MKFTDPSYTINPTIPSQIGEHQIDIKLADPLYSTTKSFYIIIEDMIPPDFMTALVTSHTVKLNNLLTYKLPVIVD